MAKTTQPEATNEQKVQTKYDRKVEARKKQKEKETKQAKISKVVGIVVAVALVAAIAVSIAVPVINKNAVLNDAYVKIGEHELTKLEYDYYYNTTVNNYLTTYASYLPYMGLDTSVDFADQTYTEGMTWKDMFDETTVGQITQVKAMVDDAVATGFTYDISTEYDSFVKGLEETAASAGTSTADYYKANYGTYATPNNIADFIKDTLLAGAYYQSVMEKNAPTDEEVKSYYQENQQAYDKVDYRSFPVSDAALTAEATEDEITKSMETLKIKADAMLEAYKAGGDFEELCIENADEDAKVLYEDETEYSLTEGAYYSGTAAAISDWLYEDGRVANDTAVLEDETNHRYYVVEFIKRYYDEADDANISNTLASQKSNEYLLSLTEKYDVTDVKGDLKYLTIEPAATTEGQATGETSTEETPVDATTETAPAEEPVTAE